jgi:hypothetical protein
MGQGCHQVTNGGQKETEEEASVAGAGEEQLPASSHTAVPRHVPSIGREAAT